MSTDSIHGFVLQQLDVTTLTYQAIAEGSGVPKRTVEKIARREIEDPGVSHVEKLFRFFQSAGAARPDATMPGGIR